MTVMLSLTLMISAGELGEESSTFESRLPLNIRLPSSWKALVLLGEADVFDRSYAERRIQSPEYPMMLRIVECSCHILSGWAYRRTRVLKFSVRSSHYPVPIWALI